MKDSRPAPTSLGERIRHAEQAEREASGSGIRRGVEFSATAIAWRVLTDLLAGVIVGFGLGWAVDVLFETTPFFLTVIGLVGTAAGVRLAMRTAKDAGGREFDG